MPLTVVKRSIYEATLDCFVQNCVVDYNDLNFNLLPEPTEGDILSVLLFNRETLLKQDMTRLDRDIVTLVAEKFGNRNLCVLGDSSDIAINPNDLRTVKRLADREGFLKAIVENANNKKQPLVS